MFQKTFPQCAKPGAAVHVRRQSIEGEIACIMCIGETPDDRYELATDIPCAQGQILVQTFTGESPKGATGAI